MSDDSKPLAGYTVQGLLADLHVMLSELKRREVGELTLVLEPGCGYAKVVWYDEHPFAYHRGGHK